MATYLRMLLRVPMQSDNFFSMVRPLVRSRARLLFKKIGVWPPRNSGFSNDQVENSFQSDCGTGAMLDQRILRWRFALCDLVHIHSTRFRALCRLLALSYLAGDSSNVRR
jgi:hypothetical protein